MLYKLSRCKLTCIAYCNVSFSTVGAISNTRIPSADNMECIRNVTVVLRVMPQYLELEEVSCEMGGHQWATHIIQRGRAQQTPV